MHSGALLLPGPQSVLVGLDGALSPPPHLTSAFLLLCFCADEMKDDFDTLGSDATLRAVGNGTGEFFFPPLTSSCFTSDDDSGTCVFSRSTSDEEVYPAATFILNNNRRNRTNCEQSCWRPRRSFVQPLIALFQPPRLARSPCLCPVADSWWKRTLPAISH